MSIVITVSAVIAGLVLVVTGLFSVAALLWGDLLESAPVRSRRDRMSRMA